ncbi:class I SAM-dependent methyltransferase, partial [Candidatus Latescibacterota bacterium]
LHLKNLPGTTSMKLKYIDTRWNLKFFLSRNSPGILEVGVGAGTDFIQWCRAGAKVYGIDITEEAVEHVKHRLDVYGLKAEEINVSDAENLPYPDNSFDLVYSWGVIHHSPDTTKAFQEIIRVTKPGGIIKIMIYNKSAIQSYLMWIKWGLFTAKPLRSISDIMYHHQESIGTKVYTVSEVKEILTQFPVTIKDIGARISKRELQWEKSALTRAVINILAFILGHETTGFFLTMDLEKKDTM